MADNLFWLTEAQFERLKPPLPDKVRGVRRADDRKVISGIVHAVKSGCRWADASPEYGLRKTLYNRWRRWAEKGHWVPVFEALAGEGGPPGQAIIDSSAVRARRSASGGKGESARTPSAARAAGGRRRYTRPATAGAARSV